MRPKNRKRLKSRKKQRTWRERMSRWWFISKCMVVLLCVGFTVGWWYLHHLGNWADRYFSRSFRWDVPSRIYSDVEYLYPGLNIASRDLRAKLDRLGYRDTGKPVAQVGDYAFLDGVIEIYLHDFDYPHTHFDGFPVRLKLANTIITEIVHGETSEVVPTVRLEPELIASVFDEKMEDRTLVKLHEVPDACLQAVVLIEDERFFKHKGIDPQGIARAAVADLKAMKVVQGGSTLTQQLVKNYFLGDERSFARKGKEALIALALERRHSKKEILEAYLNEIYLGQRGSSSVSGFGEAARLYYGKNIDQLSPGECALLAGMIRAPHRYSPFRDKSVAKERRDFVVKRLYEGGLLSKKEFIHEIQGPIVTPKLRKKVIQAPFFIDFVKQQLHELYPEDQLRAEGLRIFTTLDMMSQLIAEQSVAIELARLEETFGSKLPAEHEGKLQGALISLQPQTGYIRALVGGRSYTDTKFNRVTQAKRQPGSVFKPFVYLTAFDPSRTEHPIAPSTFIDDIGFRISSGGEMWTPHNYDKKEHGPVPAREALYKSFNIATARLAIDTGLDAIVKTAHDAGIVSDMLAVPAIALGAFEVTPLEMAVAYTIFANGGVRAEPLSIMHVMTKEGAILERKSIKMQRQFEPAPIYLVTNTLREVLDRGTAASARRLGFTGVAAGKTGTTSSYRDAWFVGFTPELLTLTWVGYDDNATTNMSGARAALPIWTTYMKQVVGNPQQDFQVPENVVLVKIDPESGKVWTNGCQQAIYAPFVEGSEPNKFCPLHEQRSATGTWKWNSEQKRSDRWSR